MADLNQLTADDVFRLIADPSWVAYRDSRDSPAGMMADGLIHRIKTENAGRDAKPLPPVDATDAEFDQWLNDDAA